MSERRGGPIVSAAPLRHASILPALWPSFSVRVRTIVDR
jgi:hypothetical protein